VQVALRVRLAEYLRSYLGRDLVLVPAFRPIGGFVRTTPAAIRSLQIVCLPTTWQVQCTILRDVFGDMVYGGVLVRPRHTGNLMAE
jgi:hypothetical protein